MSLREKIIYLKTIFQCIWYVCIYLTRGQVDCEPICIHSAIIFDTTSKQI